MADAFRSFKQAQEPTEAEIVAAAETLLAEHAAAREAAFLDINRVCGHCMGAKEAHSDIAGGLVECWACKGTGEPNTNVQAMPPISAADDARLWKLARLMQGPHADKVIALVKAAMPETFKTEPARN